MIENTLAISKPGFAMQRHERAEQIGFTIISLTVHDRSADPAASMASYGVSFRIRVSWYIICPQSSPDLRPYVSRICADSQRTARPLSSLERSSSVSSPFTAVFNCPGVRPSHCCSAQLCSTIVLIISFQRLFPTQDTGEIQVFAGAAKISFGHDRRTALLVLSSGSSSRELASL